MKSQSRRVFLEKLAILSAGMLLLPYCKKEKQHPKTIINKDILIIGAGIAGLAAAKQLSGRVRKITVIEAGQRYGGRINAVDLGGYKADLGASWIHGINGNPLYKLANKNNIKTRKTHYNPSHIYDIDGVEITNAEWRTVEKLFDKFYDLAEKNPNLSMQDLLDIMKPDLNLSEKLTRLWYGAVRSEYEIPYAVDAKDISARAVTSTDSFPGEDVIFSKGMHSLCDVLAKGINIQYNSFVSKIDYSGSKVRVFVNNTDTIDPQRSCKTCHTNSNAVSIKEDKILSADRVIVALPLGILKNKIVDFNPPLPSSKTDAINGLGIGTMNKVYLKFNANFWDDKAYFFEYLKKDSSKIIEYFSPAPTGEPNVLVAFLAGKHARSIEQKSDTEVKEMIMSDLKAMFGNNIPQAVSMHRTAWHTNILSLGSYPHLLPGSDLSVCDEIKKPLNNKVFFAGDSTSRNYMATAHGAYLSGIEAANKILGE